MHSQFYIPLVEAATYSNLGGAAQRLRRDGFLDAFVHCDALRVLDVWSKGKFEVIRGRDKGNKI